MFSGIGEVATLVEQHGRGHPFAHHNQVGFSVFIQISGTGITNKTGRQRQGRRGCPTERSPARINEQRTWLRTRILTGYEPRSDEQIEVFISIYIQRHHARTSLMLNG